MTPSEKMAEFICSFGEGGIPEEARTRATSGIMDYVGVMLAGLSEESAVIVRSVAGEMGGNSQATIWGQGDKTSCILAALANGTAAHALDLDDTNPMIMSHPSIQLLPGLFALGEYGHHSGEEIVSAYVTGFEAGARLGRALNPNLVFQGWFPVGILGTLMQTAACAKLLGLDREKTRMAIGIATNLASGLRCNNGTMAKPLIAGRVGENGILATLLASRGMNASPEAVEGRHGFFENYGRGNLSDLAAALSSSDKPLHILRTGISFKLYPCCAGAHMPIDAALALVRKHSPDPAEIEEIEVSLGDYAKFLLIHPRPRTEAHAKFSLEYCVARAFLDGRIGPEQFRPDKIQDPELLSLIERVKPDYVDAGPLERGKRLPTDMTVRMKSGEVYSTRVERARGTAGNPISQDELEEKFFRCCRGTLSESGSDQVTERLRNFERIEDIADFVTFLHQHLRHLSEGG